MARIGEYYCKVCERTVTESAAWPHEQSSRHLENVNKSVLTPETDDTPVNTSVVNTPVTVNMPPVNTQSPVTVNTRKDYMREYMRKRRAKDKQQYTYPALPPGYTRVRHTTALLLFFP